MPVPSEPDPVRPEEGSLADAAFARLSRAIIDGTLREGEILHDRDIATWLGISRTPIRDAVMRLTLLGLLETSPSRYTRVTEVDDDLVRDTLEYTGHQASLALRLAIPRMTDEQIAEACGLLDAVIDANDAGDVERLYTGSRRFVGFVARCSGNRVFLRIMRETGVTMERNLRTVRPLIGTSAERSEWYRQLRSALLERDGEYAEHIYRKQHHL